MDKCIPCTRKREIFLSLRLTDHLKVDLYKPTYYNNPYVPLVLPTYFPVTVPQFIAPSPKPFVLSLLHKFTISFLKSIKALSPNYCFCLHFPFEGSQVHVTAMQEIWVQSLGLEDTLEKGMATHSCILAWEIPGTQEWAGPQSTWSQRVGHDWTTITFKCM